MAEEIKHQGSTTWCSPSNIALVKYWGKYGRQLPSNPSISLTLSQAYTETSVDYKIIDQPSWQFTFEGKEKPEFEKKVVNFLASIKDVFPLVERLDLKIDSRNTFPHSSGIASSASSMSALAMCLVDIAQTINAEDNLNLKLASELARLGSGSASRSIYGPVAIWGDNDTVKAASNQYAIPYKEVADIFSTYHDDILIISKSEKSVSSRAGHALMENNPYALNRYEQAHRHLGEIIAAMGAGDLERFGSIVEKEALTLHALMMASEPPYMLMEPNTLAAINSIQSFRKEKSIPVYFTLDAGPNLHLLYPDEYVSDLIPLKEELITFCADGRIIEDRTGTGPLKKNKKERLV